MMERNEWDTDCREEFARIFVSNATPGERDEGVPDLSLVPVIAEIFDVSCDELLRGERRSPDERAESMDASETGLTQKGAKERRRILDVGMTRYKNQTFVAMGIAVLGLIVAMICNLCLQIPIVAFLAAMIFYLVAVVCEAVFINIAFCTVSSDEMEENDVMQFRYRVCMLAEICFGLVIVLFAACVPLLASEVGLLWELYWDLGWLLSGVVCAVPALSLYLIVLYFVNTALLRKGIYRLSEKEEGTCRMNRRLRFQIGIVLACVLVITALIHCEIWNMDKSLFVAGTTFMDYDSFVEFMEQESSVEGTASDTQEQQENMRI